RFLPSSSGGGVRCGLAAGWRLPACLCPLTIRGMRSFFESRPWLRHVLVLALVVGVLVGLLWLYGSHSRPVVFSEGEFVEAASSGRVESAVVWAESRVVEGVVVVGGERSVYRFEYLPAAEGDVLGVLRESVPDF